MAVTFYYGSGSSFGWKVWLVLEHKQIPYELKLLSFSERDHKKPDFLEVNPRGRLPAIVDNGFSLWESSAIVEYLEDRYPQNPILPGGPNTRAIARRIAAEVDNYFAPAAGKIFAQTLFNVGETPNISKLTAGQQSVQVEMQRLDRSLSGDFFVGPLSVADFSVYPTARMLLRVGEKFPQFSMAEMFSPKMKAWMKRVESLPYFEKTIPPHWKS